MQINTSSNPVSGPIPYQDNANKLAKIESQKQAEEFSKKVRDTVSLSSESKEKAASTTIQEPKKPSDTQKRIDEDIKKINDSRSEKTQAKFDIFA